MGLDYLNKKVWHPGSMKNIQKVWEAEQIQKEINKKGRERAKKLLEEQHNDELKRIQVEAGLIPRSHLDRMEWMYDWGNKINQQKTNEDYLTGQKTADERKEGKHVFQEEITNRKCEDFQLLHEDPMFEIVRQEKLRRDALLNNPIEMRNIIKEVEQTYLPEDLEQRRHALRSSYRTRSSSEERRRRKKEKKERKEKKRLKKEKKQREKDRSRSREKSKESRSHSSSEEKEKKKDRREEEREEKKGGFKQSKLYQQYLQDRMGSILKKDDDGNLIPDYSLHRPKYKTQFQLDEEERRRKIEQLRDNNRRLQELRSRSPSSSRKRSPSPKQDFEDGVANLRRGMMGAVKENRNHKRAKHSDSD